MADRSYTAVSDGSNRVIVIDSKTGSQYRSIKLAEKVISVAPTGDIVTVVTENHAGVIRSSTYKLPSLSMLTSIPIGNAPRKSLINPTSSLKKGEAAPALIKTTSAPTPSRGGGGPPLVLDDDEDSLKSLLTIRGFFSLFTMLGRIGNTLKKITGKPYNGDCLTKRDLKAIPLLLIIVFLWATCTGDNPQPREQQTRQYQQQSRQVVQRQAQSSSIRAPRTDAVVDTQNITERMRNRSPQSTPTELSDNPDDNTPPNFPNDLPRGFKRVFIQSPVGYLNMRAGPDTNSVILCQIPNNEVIYVENEDKLWLRAVRPKDNSQGYVNSGRLGEFAFPFSRTR